MINIDDFKLEKECVYKGERYKARDNGAILRIPKNIEKPRPLDNKWTFGKIDRTKGYFTFSGIGVHRIVAIAFLGEPVDKSMVVDHIDTNRQNNRISNLRWVTKFENVVLNPITRSKIEYICKKDIAYVIRNFSEYRELLSKHQNFGWMRAVSEEEANNCYNNFLKQIDYNITNKVDDKMESENTQGYGEWMFHSQDIKNYNISNINPLVIQKNWKTPTTFVCVPNGLDLFKYLNNLDEGKIFASNKYTTMTVEKYTYYEKGAYILVITRGTGIKQWGLLKIYIEEERFVHESLGSFFEYDGALKYYTINQGLEWTGGDVFDDYC